MKKLFMLLSLAAITSFSSKAQTLEIHAQPGLPEPIDVSFKISYLTGGGCSNPNDASVVFTVNPNTITYVDLTLSSTWLSGSVPSGTHGTDWVIDEAMIASTTLAKSTSYGTNCTSNPMNYTYADLGVCISTFPSTNCMEYSGAVVGW